MPPRMLNLGCGERFHPEWTNVDIRSVAPGVLQHDFRKPLPFAERSFDAVYHSHLLEHLPRPNAQEFLRECYRVLRPGGIVRVVVPDLEVITRLYLANLDGALAGNDESQRRYEWCVIELLDQMVREQSGGEMLRYWQQNPMPAEEFVIERMGNEVMRVLDQIRARRPDKTVTASGGARPDPNFWQGGELHKWMYDRYSLAQALRAAGFADPRVCRAAESAIPDFAKYQLDTDQLGNVRKPDSLFMEAKKPA